MVKIPQTWEIGYQVFGKTIHFADKPYITHCPYKNENHFMSLNKGFSTYFFNDELDDIPFSLMGSIRGLTHVQGKLMHFLNPYITLTKSNVVPIQFFVDYLKYCRDIHSVMPLVIFNNTQVWNPKNGVIPGNSGGSNFARKYIHAIPHVFGREIFDQINFYDSNSEQLIVKGVSYNPGKKNTKIGLGEKNLQTGERREKNLSMWSLYFKRRNGILIPYFDSPNPDTERKIIEALNPKPISRKKLSKIEIAREIELQKLKHPQLSLDLDQPKPKFLEDKVLSEPTHNENLFETLLESNSELEQRFSDLEFKLSQFQ